MVTSSQRAYVIPKSAAPRASAPAALLICTSTGDTQTLKGRSGSASVGSLHPEASDHLWRVWGLIINVILPLILSCWGISLPLDVGYLFLVGSSIMLSMVVQQQVVILEFLQKMNTGPLLQHFRSFDIDVKSL